MGFSFVVESFVVVLIYDCVLNIENVCILMFICHCLVLSLRCCLNFILLQYLFIIKMLSITTIKMNVEDVIESRFLKNLCFLCINFRLNVCLALLMGTGLSLAKSVISSNNLIHSFSSVSFMPITLFVFKSIFVCVT